MHRPNRDLVWPDVEGAALQPSPPRPTLRRTDRNRALVVGIDAYQDGRLLNAAGDARTIAALLDRDFGFELVGGGPLLDASATRQGIKQALELLLEGADHHDQLLFYYAGHGVVIDGRGLLVPVDGDPEDDATLIDLNGVLRSLRAVPSRGLVILDACHAGEALREADLDLQLGLGAVDGLGAIHLAAATGPGQKAPDGPPGQRSPFTGCLLAFLDGRLGWHDPELPHLRCGSIPASRLGDKLASSLAEHVDQLEELTGRRWPRPDVLVETVRPSDAGARGHFRLEPVRPRLPPQLVRDLRDALQENDPASRRRALMLLRDRVEDAKVEDARFAFELPLVLDLLLDGLHPLDASGRLDLETRPLDLGQEKEAAGEAARAFTARLLGEVLSHRRALRERGHACGSQAASRDAARAQEALLHLALRDSDAVVRHAASRALRLSNNPAELSGRLAELTGPHAQGGQTARRRVKSLLALTTGRRARRAWLEGLNISRRGWRHPWLRRSLQSAAGGLAALYALLISTYHVDTRSNGWLYLRLGPPGFEALPGAGLPILDLPWNESHLATRRLPRQPQPWGSWFAPGAFWARPIVELLSDEYAVSYLWRLGERKEAVRRLSEWAQHGQSSEALKLAAYFDLHDPDPIDMTALAERALGQHLPGDTAHAHLVEVYRQWCTIVSTPSLRLSNEEIRACPESSDETPPAPDSEMRAAAPFDLATIADQLAESESSVRSDALRRVTRHLESGNLDPLAAGEAELLLATALGDPAPWNRQEAAEGLLLLGLSDQPRYAVAFSTVFDMLMEDRTGLAGLRLAHRYVQAEPEVILRLLETLTDRLSMAGINPFERFIFSQLIEGLSIALLDREPDALPRLIDALLPLIGAHAEQEGSVSLWRFPLKDRLKSVTASVPAMGPRLADLLLSRLGSEDIPRRRAAAWLLGLCRPWLPDPEAVHSRLAASIRHGITQETPDSVWLTGAISSLLDLAGSNEESRRTTARLLVDALMTPSTPSTARPHVAWCLSAFSESLAPGRSELEALLSLIPGETEEVRSSLAECFLDWAANGTQGMDWLAPRIERLLHLETEPEIRSTWWAVLGSLVGGETSLAAVDTLAKLYDEGADTALFKAAALVSVRREATEALLAALDQRWREEAPMDPYAAVAAARRLALEDPDLARRVVSELLRPMLFEQPARLGFQVLTGGLGPLGIHHPTLAGETLAVVEEFIEKLDAGKLGSVKDPPRSFTIALEETWLKIAERRLEEDRTLVARRLRSSSGRLRRLALKLLGKLAKQQPGQRQALEATARSLERSLRPEIREVASRGLEALRLLELDEELDLEGRRALRKLAERAGPDGVLEALE